MIEVILWILSLIITVLFLGFIALTYVVNWLASKIDEQEP